MPDIDVYVQEADPLSEVGAENQVDATREAARERGFPLVPMHEEAEQILSDADPL